MLDTMNKPSETFRPYDGNQNRTGELLGVCIGFLVVSFIMVVLRLYTRLVLIKSARWDDWTIVLALLGSIVGAGLDGPEFHYGFGRHWYYLSRHQRQEFLKYTFGEWIQTFFTLMATKVSICLMLLRISPQRRITRPIQSLVAFLILSNIVLSLVWIFQCVPVAATWDCNKPETASEGAWDCEKRTTAKCFSRGQVLRVVMSQAVISIISDFILAGFPIIILCRVQMNLRQKILLCGLMGLGIFTATCCIVRTVMNWQNDHADPSWVSVDNFVWRTAEVNIGIIAACLPTLLPLYHHIRHKLTAFSANHTMKAGRFYVDHGRLLFGQRDDPSNPAQQAIQRSRRDDEITIPRNAQRIDSRPCAFPETGESEDDDVEMQ